MSVFFVTLVLFFTRVSHLLVQSVAVLIIVLRIVLYAAFVVSVDNLVISLISFNAPANSDVAENGAENVLWNDDDDDEDYVDVEENASADEDFRSSFDELVSGDEEVLASVPVDLPPRSSASPLVSAAPSVTPPVPVPARSATPPVTPSVPAPSATPPVTPPVPAASETPAAPAPSVSPLVNPPVPALSVSPPAPAPSVSPPVNPPVPAASVTPPATLPVRPSRPTTVPMDTDCLVHSDNPCWVKRLPVHVRAQLTHLTSDAHAGFAEYTSVTVPVAFDFGRLTFSNSERDPLL